MRVATRLATLIVSQGGLFFPIPENIMTSLDDDEEKPGTFLKLFPHPLSRLFVTLLWKINAEQDGDAVVLSNVWLRRFACLDNLNDPPDPPANRFREGIGVRCTWADSENT